jgi:hypothetical protein
MDRVVMLIPSFKIMEEAIDSKPDAAAGEDLSTVDVIAVLSELRKIIA